ncbi:AI-2E family transporter [Planomonospora sp. ID67723]|uniref:AI-2E family transporter n=1 Tax=Planomonospora sp. ID67723 TaxID=2738134 RepID=UPI0018C4152D|nr:AI-2E family transporter [Planomonospora sp. ID67723]MBG0829170.1 AI-2E family transporter [Planomonospora sp. ID67723]
MRRPGGGTALWPRSLVVSGGWAVWLVVVAAAGYVLLQMVVRLRLVVLACVVALLLATVLRPPAVWLMRRMPRLAATWLVLFAALLVIGVVGWLIGRGAAAEFPALADRLVESVRQLRDLLARLGVPAEQLARADDQALEALRRQLGKAGGVTAVAGRIVEFLAGTVLAIFIAFFLIKDGDRLWRWLVDRLPERLRERVDRAGGASWSVLRHYIQGTLVIASIHAVVLGLAMVLLGVPLALPLAVIIFFGSFIPFIGSLVAGSLAVVVALGARGPAIGLVLLIVLLVENQLEEHVLEPWVMGGYVRVHPLVIGLALSSGTILGGVAGALVSVPLTAIAYYGGRELLRGRPPEEGRDSGDPPEEPGDAHPPGDPAPPRHDGAGRPGDR